MELLEAHEADRCRVMGYVKAADTVQGLGEDRATILREMGIEGLIALPKISKSLARAIDEMVEKGGSAHLERLRGAGVPEELF